MSVKHRYACQASILKLALFLAIVITSPAVFADDESEDQNKSLYEAACTPCHGLAPIERTRDGRQGWQDTVQKMVVIGAQLDTEEMDRVIDHLYRTYGPGTGDPMRAGILPADSPMQADGRLSSENVVLPEGEGKQMVQGLCTMCHDLGVVVATRRSSDDWQHYTSNMLRQNGIRIAEDKQEVMVSYLHRYFGKVDQK